MPWQVSLEFLGSATHFRIPSFFNLPINLQNECHLLNRMRIVNRLKSRLLVLLVSHIWEGISLRQDSNRCIEVRNPIRFGATIGGTVPPLGGSK
jgi:hypothetical protein